MIWSKKSPIHIKYWPRIDPFFPKNQNFAPKHKILKNQWENLADFIIVKFQNFDFLKVPYFCRINSGQIFYMYGSFLGQITTKKLSLHSWEITKKSFRGKLLKIFHFFTLWIWLFGIFDKRPQGCYEVKYSMGLLQGPRLMARTTKSPIRRNHWVPLGCRGHLGSVKTQSPEFFLICNKKTITKRLQMGLLSQILQIASKRQNSLVLKLKKWFHRWLYPTSVSYTHLTLPTIYSV